MGGWYCDQLLVDLIEKNKPQVASPSLQCGPPQVVPQQLGDTDVIAGIGSVAHKACSPAVDLLEFGLVVIQVEAPNRCVIIHGRLDQ